jgi:hypothetical protein
MLLSLTGQSVRSDRNETLLIAHSLERREPVPSIEMTFLPEAASFTGAGNISEEAGQAWTSLLQTEAAVPRDAAEFDAGNDGEWVASDLGAGWPDRDGGRRIGRGTGVTGAGSAAGSGNGSFFGVPCRGSTVIFVVDCSESMRQMGASRRQSRLLRVKEELAASIEALSERQRFLIIFFNGAPVQSPQKEPHYATGAARKRALNWISEIAGGGGTRPLPAMEQALAFGPEEVFLLTDGKFGQELVPKIAALNVRGTRIHTIGVGETASSTLLRIIAKANGGEHVDVP